MTDLAYDSELEPQEEVEVEPREEETEEPSFQEQVRDALFEEEEEVASTDAPDEEVEEHPSPQASSQEPSETPEEQELRWARTIAAEIKANPQLGDALVALKQGKAKLLPNEVIEAFQQVQQTSEPAKAEEEPDFWEDPEAAIKRVEARNQEIAARIEAFESQQRQSYEAQQRQVYETNQNLFFDTAEEYRRTHPELSDSDMVKIINSAAESGFVAKYKRQHGDNKRALAEAFEAARRVEFPQHTQTPEQIARSQRSKRRAGAAAASPRTSQRLKPEEPTKPGFDGIKEFLAESLREAENANQ